MYIYTPCLSSYLLVPALYCNDIIFPRRYQPSGVDVAAYMPSSAYRKLAEALNVMGLGPDDLSGAAAAAAGHTAHHDHERCERASVPALPVAAAGSLAGRWACADLGASPGGWTALLRRFGAAVVREGVV